MRAVTTKPIAAVRLESCVLDDEGNVSDYGRKRLTDLRETYYVYILSPKAQSLQGLRYLHDLLGKQDLAYDEVWAGGGLPEADTWFDAGTEQW